MVYKDTKWAKEIIESQDDEGKWGTFHSLSQPTAKNNHTTEQALRRLERLGYTMEDECIQKAVAYMNDCLIGKKSIPDYREKVHDWNIFTSLILSTWIRRFTNDNPAANEVAKKWADIISSSFVNGTFIYEEYVAAYTDILGLKPNGGRLVDFVNFYPISLVCDCLDQNTQQTVVDYIINRDNGIYYIYHDKIAVLPSVFESKKASYYLAAIELLSKYVYARYKAFMIKYIFRYRMSGEKVR